FIDYCWLTRQFSCFFCDNHFFDVFI
ncbi:hypothetical protein A5847_002363, partial [Enterococcus faecium]